MTKYKYLITLLLTVCSSQLFGQFKLDEQSAKLIYTLSAVNSLYVDSVKENNLVESAIVGMLKDLDPHSVYIPKDEVARMDTNTTCELTTKGCTTCPTAVDPGARPACCAATGASSRPIMATTAPITAGGITTSIQRTPHFLTTKEMITKNNPKKIKPD